MRPGDRVKVIDSNHPAYGRVGTIEQVTKRGALVRLDYYPLATGVALKGLRRVKKVAA